MVDYLFPIFTAKEQIPMKEQNEMFGTYCKHSRHLSVCGQYRKRFSAQSSTASSPSQLFHLCIYMMFNQRDKYEDYIHLIYQNARAYTFSKKVFETDIAVINTGT